MIELPTQLYLSNIIQSEEIAHIRPGEFNILKAPRGSGKTTVCLDDKILELARERKHVLYLIHNKFTRDAIATAYPSVVKVFDDCNCNGWFMRRKKGLWTTEEEENYVHIMCYQTFAALLRNEGTDWLEDIDLIIWDEFDDIRGFYEKEVKQLKKVLPDFSRERLIAILQEGRAKSVVNFIYQLKVFVLDPAQIKLLAISATPENAAYYFRDYINYILNGQIEEIFSAEQTIYISDVISAIKDGTIKTGRKYWCYTRYVHHAFEIENVARARGFNPIVLWSEENPTWQHLMTPERKRALKMIRSENVVPPEYDMVIITAIGMRSINLYDTSFQDWICNSDDYEDIGQYIRARFCPSRQYLLEKVKGLVDFIRNGFSIDYYNWHNLEELKILLEEKPIYTKDINNRKKLTTMRAVVNEYPDLFEKRQYGRAKTTQYRIKPTE